MRLNRLVIPLAVLVPFALASPAMGAEMRVDALDYEFRPAAAQIAVGDSVTWNFVDNGHTATSVAGQAERWDSGSVAAGGTYSHAFTTPGKYQYICIPHQAFEPPMKGVITVGTDAVAKTVSRFRTRRRGNRVNVAFTLNEPAKVTYRLRGAARRTVKRGRLARGTRSITVRRLKRGPYTGVLSVVDDFDKTQTARSSFVVR